MHRLRTMIAVSGILAAAVIAAIAARDARRDDINATERELVGMLLASDPRAALRELARRMDADPGLAAHCHPVVHAIGRAAFAKYGDFERAMSYQDELCNSGYIHGVIESLFAATPDAERVAAATCRRTASGSYRNWSCWHGIGHGHMAATANDLPEALARCERLDDAFARDACVNGAFMENFNADDGLHPSRWLRRDDPSYPCGDLDERYRSSCYFYAPTWYLRLHPRAYADALTWCATMPPAWQDACAGGVGGQTMKENVSAPSAAERTCGDAPPPLVGSCIDGMVGLYVNHHASIEAGRALCATVAIEHRATCVGSIEARAPMFAVE